MDFPPGAIALPRAAYTAFSGATGVLRLPREVPTSESVSSTHTSISASSTSRTHTTTSSISTSNRPFFQDPSQVTPPPTQTPDDTPGHTVPKVVLEYILIAAFILIFGGLLIHRLMNRRRNRDGLFPSTAPRTTDGPPLPQRFPRTTGVSEVPPYPYALHTRAADTDVAGRRVGIMVDSDHDGYIGDKDVLPAYDNTGRPPKYREVALELNVLPNPGRTNGPPNATTGNSGNRRSVVGEPGTGRRSSQVLSDFGSGDAALGEETLTVPAAVHVRRS